MKKRLFAALTALTVVFAMAGCSSTPQTDSVEPQTEEQVTETEETTEEVKRGAAENILSSASGLSMSIATSRGPMQIRRAEKKSTPMGDEDSWTVFLYLCGTDLESRVGFATGDMGQLLNASMGENVRFVVQTGGTATWQNDVFDNSKCERYVIENGDIELVDSVALQNMGDAETLADFLKWGVENYPAEKMGVDIWDHGCGCIGGAAIDEVNGCDSLFLAEMDQAFAAAYEEMTDQFEFIGFDCCLMGTAEVANIMASYARYFFGSQETEPGSGWDYTAIFNYISENPSCSGGDLGKVVADSFYQECASSGQEDGCTFTIVDLSNFDDFVIAFNDYAMNLYDAAGENLSDIVRGILSADNFGGNNKTEGYTNMVDLGGIVSQCSDYVDGSDLLEALEDVIVYNINGKQHKDASGLSVYYPLHIGGSSELKIYSGITLSPYYLSIVDMVAKGYTEGGYDNAIFFDADGAWDSDTPEEDDSYFEYADEEDEGLSQLITFSQEPTLDDNGTYRFTLDEDGLEYAVGVEAMIYMEIDDEHTVELGETYDIIADWETGEFEDNFDGYWLSLPDGQLLPTYIVDADEDMIVYTSPILLNGERTNLRIIQDDDGCYIDGAWDGIDENGVPSRDVRKIKEGDEITVVYTLISSENVEDNQEFTLDPYTWQKDDEIIYSYLEASNYYYGFAVEDVYGDYYVSDFVTFAIDENGEITFLPA